MHSAINTDFSDEKMIWTGAWSRWTARSGERGLRTLTRERGENRPLSRWIRPERILCRIPVQPRLAPKFAEFGQISST